MAATFDFRVPPIIAFGVDTVNRVGRDAKGLGAARALLVTDQNMVNCGSAGRVQQLLNDQGIEVTLFPDIATEPTQLDVDEGLRRYQHHTCDLLVALGGGSSIDAAKAVAVLATNGGRISDYMGADKVRTKKAPLIAIPTTAGTGSEVTRVTIITDTLTNIKMPIGSPFIVPEVAIVDPALTVSCPRNVTAGSGLDALCHAVESYISKRANPLTETLSLSAIGHICSGLRQAWTVGNDLNARSQVMLGALEAGMAFSNASVALVHGMARPLGAFFNIPHGPSNAILLPHVLAFTVGSAPQRFADIARAMSLDVQGLDTSGAAERAIEGVIALCQDLRMPTLTEAGVDPDRLKVVAGQMARDAVASGSPGNNPREASVEDIMQLYEQAL